MGPFSMYAPRGRGGGQASYTFPLRITCKKGVGGWVQIACKISYVLNGRPLSSFNSEVSITVHTLKYVYTQQRSDVNVTSNYGHF